MKRAMLGKTAMAIPACLALAACSPSATPQTDRVQTEAPAGWTRPPAIAAVQGTRGSLVFTGQAEPGARVVLRADSGAAYAAAADDGGRFEIRMAAPAGDLLLRPETQVGQDAAHSPDRLLIVAGGRGPIVILRPGGPTRRLDRAPALGAIDSDGRMRLASGTSSSAVELQAGGESGRVAPDSSGRWSLALGPSAGPDEIRVGARTFAWPGEGAPGTALRVERAGEGWRVVWTGPAGARQSTWLPDAA
ncbi:MAG: hypothetical protein Q8Q71_01595 [Brevundimonas sp.]|nr:hypothetical protein [Brevundimonas sp.]